MFTRKKFRNQTPNRQTIMKYCSLISLFCLLLLPKSANAQHKGELLVKSGFTNSSIDYIFFDTTYMEDAVWNPSVGIGYRSIFKKYFGVEANMNYFSVGGQEKSEISTEFEPDGIGEYFYSSLRYDYVSMGLRLHLIYPLQTMSFAAYVGTRLDFFATGTSYSSTMPNDRNHGWDLGTTITKNVSAKSFFRVELGYQTFADVVYSQNLDFGGQVPSPPRLLIDPSNAVSVMVGFGIRL